MDHVGILISWNRIQFCKDYDDCKRKLTDFEPSFIQQAHCRNDQEQIIWFTGIYMMEKI